MFKIKRNEKLFFHRGVGFFIFVKIQVQTIFSFSNPFQELKYGSFTWVQYFFFLKYRLIQFVEQQFSFTPLFRSKKYLQQSLFVFRQLKLPIRIFSKLESRLQILELEEHLSLQIYFSLFNHLMCWLNCKVWD